MKNLITKTKLFLVFVALFGFCISLSHAQVQITSGQTITQNFNAIGLTASAPLPTGWKVSKDSLNVRAVGTYATATSNTERIGGNAMSNTATNGIYNFGAGVAATATDRAVGFLSSSTKVKSGNLYLKLQNNGVIAIDTFKISFDVEKYRNGTNASGYTFKMYYSTDGTTWTDAGANFTTNFAGADADNNGFVSAPGSVVSVTAQNLIVSVAQGSNLYLAWNYSVTSGTTTSSAKALGIDNVSIQAVAHSGIFEQYVITNNGTDAYDAGNIFNGKNFGNIATNGTFILKGGQIKTWKNGTDDITGARMFYRIYEQSATPPAFTSVTLPFSTNLSNPGDQLWQKNDLALNIINGLPLGNYFIETYFEADYTSNSTPAIHVDNNNGANYIASFAVVPPPAQSGIFEVSVITNNGADVTDLGATFNGKNFGNIPTNGTFILKGGQEKTWKNGSDDITGTRMFYRIYQQTATPPAFTSVTLPFSTNLSNPGDQLWQKNDLALNIINGLPLGNYFIETYFEADYTSGGTPGIYVDNNSGANYIATFAVVTPPAQSGILRRYIVTNAGTNTFTEGAAFNNSNLGSFQQTGIFVLKGGELKTWRNNPPDSITAAHMFYRIYLQGGTPPAFTSINLPWLSDSLPNQVWENISNNISILSGLTPGNYFLETYFEADYNTNGTPSGTHIDNNGGLNYKATFTLLCPTSTIPFAEGFNSISIPSCWSQIQEGTTTLNWAFVPSATYPTAPYEGADFARLSSTSSLDNKVKLVSPVINLQSAVIPFLSFRHFMKAWGTDQDELRVFYRTSATSAWVLLDTYISDVSAWTERKITLPFGTATYQIAFEGNAKYGYGIAIDNVKIEQPPANDMAMVEWVSPLSNCGLSATEPIIVKIANLGSQPQTGVGVVASIDGGSTLIGPIEYLPGTIQPGTTMTYTFTHTANMATPKIYYCGALVHLTNDANVHNDTAVAVVYNMPLINTFPYTQNFDLYSGWMPGIISGTQQWELGLPAKTQLHTDYSGMNSKAWVTKITGNYDNDANVTLTSPCLNFTNLNLPMFSVYLNIKTEVNYDAMVLESSVDGGTTWNQVIGDAGFYNNTSTYGDVTPPKWSGTNGGWTKYETSLPDLSGEANVKLRFRFQSDDTGVDEGIAIDAIRIYDPLSKDVGASVVLSPVNSLCGSVTDTLKVVVSNYGSLIQNNIPVKIKVVTPNTTLNFTDTLLGSILANHKDTLIAQTINTLTPGTYYVTAYSALTGDLDHTNDTIHYSFVVTQPLAIPYVENFEGTVQGWQTDMTVGTGHGSLSHVLYENLYSSNTTAYAQSPKLGTIVTGDFLSFDYRIVNYGSPWPATTIGAGDTIKILVSNDCGTTFNILDTIYDNKHITSNVMATKHYTLDAYNGDNIIVKFDLQRQTAGDYYVDIDNFIIGSLPVVDLGNDTTICSNASITLDAGNATPYATYSWTSVPAGFTSTIRNPTVSPTVSTEYIVVVNNGFGSTATDSIIVGIKPAPVLNLGADLQICHASSTTIDAGLETATIVNEGLRGVLPTNWTAFNGGGQPIVKTDYLLLDNVGDTVISDAYNLTGLTNVKLYVDIASYGAGTSNNMIIWVSNNNGTTWNAQIPLHTDTIGNTTYIHQGPFAVTATGTHVKFKFIRPQTTGKGVRFRDFKITSSAPYASYTWSTGVHTQSITVNNAGNFWCEVVGANGCSDRDTIGVSFYTVPVINFGTDTAICAGGSLLLDAGTSFATYQWNGNASLNTHSFTVTAAGTYWVVAHDSHGCISGDTISVIINPLPVVNLGPNVSICPGTKDTLNAGAGINYSYIWKKIGSTSVIGTAQKLIVNTAGTYYVVVNNGCAVTATDSITIAILPPTLVNLGQDANICPLTPTQLDAGTHASYLWNTGAITQHITITLPGVYSVTVTDANTCKDADSITIGLYGAPTVHLGHDTTICIYNSILLNAGIGNTSYAWFNGTTSQTLLVQGSVFGLGLIHASVIVTNANGCHATDTINITVDPCTGIEEATTDGIQIYPNPSNGLLFVALNGNFKSSCDVFVYNVQGQLIKSQNIINTTNGSIFELDMSKQSKGVYFVKIINGEYISVNKIVLN